MSKLVQIRSTRDPVGLADATLSSVDTTETIPGHTDQPTIDPALLAGPRVYLETLGCQMNEADSAIIMGQLRARGYHRVDDPAAADVILLNTCAIRAISTMQGIDELIKLATDLDAASKRVDDLGLIDDGIASNGSAVKSMDLLLSPRFRPTVFDILGSRDSSH